MVGRIILYTKDQSWGGNHITSKDQDQNGIELLYSNTGSMKDVEQGFQTSE